MCYILYMNKDVIYIEPEDDITDIIGKIEKSKEKIVALVPPKKAGVFRSIVNIKLIAKTGASAGKSIVLVTVDPSITKLAANAKLPVTKNLQTAPSIPKLEDDNNTISADIDEADDSEEEADNSDEKSGTEDDDENDATKSNDNDDTDNNNNDKVGEDDSKEVDAKMSAKPDKTPKKRLAFSNPIVSWLKEHKKLAIFSGIGVILLILFFIWAFVIAPSVDVSFSIRTTKKPFSESVTFTTKLEEEDANAGKFYLEEKKVESTQEVSFDATGKKNIGDVAHGELVIFAYFPLNIKGTVVVDAGTKFTISDLSYSADESVAIVYDGKGSDKCDNNGNFASLVQSGCLTSARVSVKADGPGTAYNIAPSSTGWSTVAQVHVYSDEPMTGGTDQEITVVQQSDIDKAKTELAQANVEDQKQKLMENLGENNMAINSSFAQSSSDAVSTPKVGEEVKSGEKAKLKVTTTASVLVVDKAKVEEYITKKADLGENQKIYVLMDPFVESFAKTDSGYTGKLKTYYLFGPTVTETSVVELIKGKGLGDAQHALKDINGVFDVKLNPSFPWVTSIPNDSNRISVSIEVKDQEGNPIEQQNSEEKNEAEKDTTKADEKATDKDGAKQSEE